MSNSLKIESQDESGVIAPGGGFKVCHERRDELRLGEVGVLDGRQREEPPRGDENAGWGGGVSKKVQWCNFPNFGRNCQQVNIAEQQLGNERCSRRRSPDASIVIG